jgi:hypothetical protein
VEILSDSGAPAKSREATEQQPSSQGSGKPSLTIITARFGHPHHDRPLILVGGREVAWCSDQRDATLWAELLEEHPELAATLAEDADDYVDSPSDDWRIR